MALSHLKRIENEICLLETESDKIIKSENYYIIRIKINMDIPSHEVKESQSQDTILSESSSFEEDENCDQEEISIEDLSQKLLLGLPDHQPSIVYFRNCEIFLLFSCLDENKIHFLGGSHHKLCSKYCSYICNIFNGKYCVECSIIEFDSQTKIFTYFLSKVHNFYFNFLVEISEIDNASELSISELEKNIDVKNWVDPDKFGTFFKLNKGKKNSIYISSLSKLLSAKDIENYRKFLFS